MPSPFCALGGKRSGASVPEHCTDHLTGYQPYCLAKSRQHTGHVGEIVPGAVGFDERRCLQRCSRLVWTRCSLWPSAAWTPDSARSHGLIDPGPRTATGTVVVPLSAALAATGRLRSCLLAKRATSRNPHQAHALCRGATSDIIQIRVGDNIFEKQGTWFTSE